MSDSFAELLDRLSAGESLAASEIHQRFTPRLIALARSHLDSAILRKTEPESAVQSALGSFFHRYDRGEFQLGTWDDLWGLLAIITVRKAVNRARYYTREQRDLAREQPLDAGEDSSSGAIAPTATGPSPPEAVIFAETLTLVLDDLNAQDRRIIEWLLAGYTIEETRRFANCSERTVRRVRDRVRLKLHEIDETLARE